MIAFALLALAGLYLTLLVVAGMRSRSWPQRAFWWAALLAPLAWLTWDMPVGYYRFQAMCAKEGGVRVFDQKPGLARVLRLDADGMKGAGGGLLVDYPTLVAIEAGDERYQHATPPAYARYERDPLKSEPATTLNKLQYNSIVSRLIDRVEQRRNGFVTVEQGPSDADYVLRREHWTEPIRMNLTRYTLQRPDGRIVATSSRIGYSWTNSDYTVLAVSRVDECGGPTDGYKPLLDLIAQRKGN